MELLSDKVVAAIVAERKEIEPCLVLVECTVPADAVKTGVEAVARGFASQADLPGFRRGKAPSGMIRQRFKKQIEGEALSQFVSAAFRKNMDDKGFEPLSYRLVDQEKLSLDIDAPADLKFSISFNLAPQFELPAYKGVKVELPKINFGEAQVEEQLLRMREAYGKFDKVEGPAQEKDMLKVSYTSDFEIPDDMPDYERRVVKSDENFLWLTADEFIPGVVAALTGAKAGQDYDFEANFPEGHENKRLAGKKIKYHVSVKEIQRKQPLGSDEELCKAMRVKDVEELKGQIRKQAEAEHKRAGRTITEAKAMDALLEGLDFPLPPDMLKEAIETEMRRLARGNEPEQLREKAAELAAEAEKCGKEQLRRQLFLRKIATKEDIKVESHELDSEIEMMSRYLGFKDADLKKRLVSNGGIGRVADDVLLKKVADFIVDHAEITYVDGGKEAV